MSTRALVVDDDPEIVRNVADNAEARRRAANGLRDLGAGAAGAIPAVRDAIRLELNPCVRTALSNALDTIESDHRNRTQRVLDREVAQRAEMEKSATAHLTVNVGVEAPESIGPELKSTDRDRSKNVRVRSWSRAAA